jgi:branched-subunit amino acid transport protein
MTDTYIWTVVVGMGVLNYALRLVPFAVLSRMKLPDWATRFLSFVPVAVMSALVVGEVVRPGGAWLTPWHNPYLWAAVGTALVYWRWRSFLGATLAGIAMFIALRWLLGFVPF